MKNSNAATQLTLALVFLVGSPLAVSAERMKSGKWEMTSDGRRARTNTECVTAQSAADINGTPATMRAFIEKNTAGANCTIQSFKMEDDTVSYTSVCKGVSVDSATTYRGDSYEMVMKSTVTGRAPETSRVTAKRVGAC